MRKRYLKSSDVISANRHERGELNDRLLHEWATMTVREALADNQLDTVRGTMALWAQLGEPGPESPQGPIGPNVQQDEHGLYVTEPDEWDERPRYDG